ncbi:hypothetical protein [Piscinibacter sakaiensis]|uniref:Pteridine-dependent dioxygenase n=1 Tax=Piscinibacter sakaiensis TaxID=1547922 RepID=A0A0K8P3W1_PISS1|nr:hypothetical protein [Piscinibacter sakaiensis]GAP37302.1 pteridine-dependent dioxygenase [Piscinibacter sakaiensis]
MPELATSAPRVAPEPAAPPAAGLLQVLRSRPGAWAGIGDTAVDPGRDGAAHPLAGHAALLGGLQLGAAPDWRGRHAGGAPWAGIAAPVLSAGPAGGAGGAADPGAAAAVGPADAGPRTDWLLGGPACHSGRHGPVAWCHDGHWLFGRLELDEDDAAAAPGETALEAATRHGYAALFEVLAATGFPHLQRLWNYVPRINAVEQGMERYRQFNAGRQRAFLAAGHAAFAGAPAACALGVPAGPLRVAFLAGRVPAAPVENPRQVSAYHYPREFGPRAPTFSRAALGHAGPGRLALWVSGTASIVGHQSLHPGDVVAQAREAVANLRAVVGAAARRCTAALAVEQLQAVVYLRRPADRPAVQAALAELLGPAAPLLREAAWLQADICRAELLVEIEGHQFADGERLAEAVR